MNTINGFSWFFLLLTIIKVPVVNLFKHSNDASGWPTVDECQYSAWRSQYFNAVSTIFKQASYFYVPSYLAKWVFYFSAVSTIFKQASYHPYVPSSLFCFSGKVTSKNLQLVSCFVKSNFYWQSAEIRFPYHLGSIYAKYKKLLFTVVKRNLFKK